jgi:hypothetical protein
MMGVVGITIVKRINSIHQECTDYLINGRKIRLNKQNI